MKKIKIFAASLIVFGAFEYAVANTRTVNITSRNNHTIRDTVPGNSSGTRSRGTSSTTTPMPNTVPTPTTTPMPSPTQTPSVPPATTPVTPTPTPTSVPTPTAPTAPPIK